MEINNPLIEWSDSCLTGIARIDAQHQGLVSGLNSLGYLALKQKFNAKKFIQELDCLIRCFSEHFAEEEKVMLNFEYEEDREHRDRHSEILKKLFNLRVKVLITSDFKSNYLLKSLKIFKLFLEDDIKVTKDISANSKQSSIKAE
ncbi:bacteriohemerythrin [Pelagibaculum spongiae]|uniref:bacteriohemerythrin n=1 Tax=Pelagibaculum spongiae TaxID=2080658 RepID=UPI001314F495|nr:hemerythrin family protein [Pelagibaculum spongiae]